MTIETSKHVDRLKTWGCGFLVALAVAGALAVAFFPWGRGGGGSSIDRRMDDLEKRVEALEAR